MRVCAFPDCQKGKRSTNAREQRDAAVRRLWVKDSTARAVGPAAADTAHPMMVMRNINRELCPRPTVLMQTFRPELILVGDVTNDFPAAVGLLAEDVHARFLRNRLVRRADRNHLERPNEPHDSEIARNNDLFDLK
jgi:hypothetical protein